MQTVKQKADNFHDTIEKAQKGAITSVKYQNKGGLMIVIRSIQQNLVLGSVDVAA